MIGSLHSVLISRVSRKEKRVEAGGGTGKSLLTGLQTLDSWQPSQKATAEGWQRGLHDCDHRRKLTVNRTVTTEDSWQSTGLWPQQKAGSLQDCDNGTKLTVYRTVTTRTARRRVRSLFLGMVLGRLVCKQLESVSELKRIETLWSQQKLI